MPLVVSVLGADCHRGYAQQTLPGDNRLPPDPAPANWPEGALLAKVLADISAKPDKVHTHRRSSAKYERHLAGVKHRNSDAVFLVHSWAA